MSSFTPIPFEKIFQSGTFYEYKTYWLYGRVEAITSQENIKLNRYLKILNSFYVDKDTPGIIPEVIIDTLSPLFVDITYRYIYNFFTFQKSKTKSAKQKKTLDNDYLINILNRLSSHLEDECPEKKVKFGNFLSFNFLKKEDDEIGERPWTRKEILEKIHRLISYDVESTKSKVENTLLCTVAIIEDRSKEEYDSKKNEQIIYFINQKIQPNNEYHFQISVVPVDEEKSGIHESFWISDYVNHLFKEKNISIKNWIVNDNFIALSKEIQLLPTIDEQINFLFAKFRSYSNFYLINKGFWFVTMLAYHSVNKINFLQKGIIRGGIWLNVVGETSNFKTTINKAIQKIIKNVEILESDKFTKQALIGGTRNTQGERFVYGGIISKVDNAMLVFDEFHLAIDNMDILDSLRDLLSDTPVHNLSRVDGIIKHERYIRLVTLSNFLGDEIINNTRVSEFTGIFKQSINSEPLWKRVDLVYTIDDKKHSKNTFQEQRNALKNFKESTNEDKILPQYLKESISFAWTLTPEKIIYEEGLEEYLIDAVEEIYDNFWYEGFGFLENFDAKILKASISIAAMLMSTMNKNRFLLVKKEHVKYIKDWYITTYSEPPYNLKQVAKRHRKKKYLTPEQLIDIDNRYILRSDTIIFLENNLEIIGKEILTKEEMTSKLDYIFADIESRSIDKLSASHTKDYKFLICKDEDNFIERDRNISKHKGVTKYIFTQNFHRYLDYKLTLLENNAKNENEA